jgi:glutaredoxin-like YruB-family protein
MAKTVGEQKKHPRVEGETMVTVKVYSTQTCPYCRMAKDFLKRNKVKFEDIDVSADQAKARQMVEKSGQMGVPVIEIGDTIIVGYDEEAIKNALKLKK